MSGGKIAVTVACALVSRQAIYEVSLCPGSTVLDAVTASGVLSAFPEISLSDRCVGVFGRQVSLGTLLRDGDRIELYRPLVADPKDTRRKRALSRRRSR